MNELIRIDDKGLTSARELHEFLEIKRYFTQWIEPYIKDNNDYGFAENIDFTRINADVNPTNGVPTIDYAITIEMAKELSMLSKTTKGKDARKYFIKIEKAWNSPEMIMKRALEFADRKVKSLEIENLSLRKEKQVNEPKVHYHDWILSSPSLMPITSIAKDYGMTAEEMNKLLHKLKVQYKIGEQWILYRQHDKAGYTSSKPLIIKHKSKPAEVKNQTQWTQKGKNFIYDLLKENEILPLIEREDA